MRFRWSALAVFVLALVLMPRDGQAQGTARKAVVTVKQNYPNPFNPETRGEFEIGCTDVGAQYRVSVKIYNLLMQSVATPVLQGGKASVAGGTALTNVLLPCGQFTWYWNGNYQNTRKEAASGVYILVVDVSGQRVTRTMTNAK
jgi:hypothetical protein